MAANTNNANSNSSTGTVVGNHAKPNSSPWTQIVWGESESIAAGSSLPSPSSPSTAVIAQAVQLVEEEGVENGSGTNGNAGKKPAWSRPSNGAAEVGSVMGGQWPALSESARVSSKAPSDSPKILSDGSSSSSSSSVVSQGTGNASFSSQKFASNNANSNSTPNHTMPVRQRSMKRGGASSNGSVSQPPQPGSAVEAPLNSPSRDQAQRSGFISQSHSGNDHPQHRNSFRNRNGGPHPRGDGSHTQNYGRRRNQDHVNQDWNSHRNFNGRDAHLQPQRGVPRSFRHVPQPQPPPPPPLPNTPQYMAHSPSQPFGTPMGFPEIYYVPIQAHPDSLRSVPFIAPMPSFYFTPPDSQLHAKIVSQIDYYFSNENLIKDTFLRQNMNDHGWVAIKLIAGFKKVLHLTEDIQLILDAVRSSSVVEVQGDKIRRRNDWKRWIMPPSALQFTNISSPRPGENSSLDMLTATVRNISLDQNATNQGGSMNQENVHAESLAGRSSSGDLNNLLPSSSEGMADNAQGAPARTSS